MTPEEAKEILLLFRPGTADEADPEMREALALARAHPELGRWFEQHCAFQDAVRRKLRSTPVPPDLKEAILAQAKVVELPPWWQRTPVVAAACAAVLILFAALYFLWNPTRPEANQFSDFQARMVSTVLREYRMDVATNDTHQVRQYMASRGSPADYKTTPGLDRLALAGGGFLRWRNHPVSMVCFRRPDREMVYLFVMDRAAVAKAPSPEPKVERVKDLVTASWTDEGKVYLLAAPSEQDITSALPRE